MNQSVTVARNGGDIMESVLLKGDLGKLTPNERVDYYRAVCESVGLNPLTKPFEYITLNGKLTLYALRSCTDQLRSIHNVSVVDLIESERDGVFVVTAKVRNGEGRTDMAKGAVTIANLKGEALANALMKAETKAKRRATLSMCGLGMLDETEIEAIPGAKPAAAPVAIAAPAEAAADPETGEVGPRQVDPGEPPKWITFGSVIIAGVRAATSIAEMDQWQIRNAANLQHMKATAPKAYSSVKAAFDGRRQALADQPKRLSDADSAAALTGLTRQLVKCANIAAVDDWDAATRRDYEALTDADRERLDEAEAKQRENVELDIPPELRRT